MVTCILKKTRGSGCDIEKKKKEVMERSVDDDDDDDDEIFVHAQMTLVLLLNGVGKRSGLKYKLVARYLYTIENKMKQDKIELTRVNVVIG